MRTMFRTALVLAASMLCASLVTAAKPPAKPDELARMKTEVEVLKADIAFLKERLQKLEQALGPVMEEAQAKARQQALRPRFEQRSAADKKLYAKDQLDEAWRLHLHYQDMDIGWGSKQARKDEAQVVKKVPKSNVAGCALLYLARMSEGEEQEKYLQQAIRDYSDCFYGDGVQVGAYARYLLAQAYLEKGDKEKADRLFEELKSQFPGAIDHNGRLLLTEEP